MHGYAAMAPEDEDDARRGFPAGTLEAWAAGHGLAFVGRGTVPGFEAGLPEHPEYMHNLVHGTLPGIPLGRSGVLFHELLQTHFRGESQVPGTFYGRQVVTGPDGTRGALRPNRTWIPVIGSWLNPPEERPDEPFGTYGAWAPCTTAVLTAPEAAAAFPWLRARLSSRAYALRGPGERSIGSFRVTVDSARTSDDAVEALTAAGFVQILEELGGTYLDADLRGGVLRVCRNGYTIDAAELDRFTQGLAAAAAVLAEVAAAHPPTAPSSAHPLDGAVPAGTEVRAAFTLDLSRWLSRRPKGASDGSRPPSRPPATSP